MPRDKALDRQQDHPRPRGGSSTGPPAIEARVKCWFAVGAGHVFGEGQARLLEEIERHGTLRDAAKALGMSYRHAWGMLRKVEQRLAAPLIDRSHGGRGGGHSSLTPLARSLLKSYRRLERAARELADECTPDLGASDQT